MTIPSYQELMEPVLRCATQGERRVPEVAEKIADDLGLSAEERDEPLPSGRQTILHNRIHWAKFYMTKAGLIESPARGRFLATEKGKQFLQSYAGKISTRSLMQFSEFADFFNASHKQNDKGDGNQAVSDTSDDEQTATPEEQIEAAYRSLNAALRG